MDITAKLEMDFSHELKMRLKHSTRQPNSTQRNTTQLTQPRNCWMFSVCCRCLFGFLCTSLSFPFNLINTLCLSLYNYLRVSLYLYYNNEKGQGKDDDDRFRTYVQCPRRKIRSNKVIEVMMVSILIQLQHVLGRAYELCVPLN